MAEFKLVLGFKNGKCVQREVKDAEASALTGKKIGETIDGSSIGLEGYEFIVTGGSDKVGFPMRKDVSGSARKKILAVQGVGLKKKAKGVRQRKTVAGNTIHEAISQINLKVVKVGKEDLSKAVKKAEAKEGEEAPAEKKEEGKAEEKPKKEEPKAETNSEQSSEKPQAKPEEKKEAPKAEEKPKGEKKEEKKEEPKDKPKEEKKD